MNVVKFEKSFSFAKTMDEQDPLRSFRSLFHIPHDPKSDREFRYFSGNSLGLQPVKTKEYIELELEDWARLGVEGHLNARHPWLPYHENLTEQTARLVGAFPIEVVVMNTLTVNLHLMMVSFYRPTPQRHMILMEASAFPSDQYAIASQVRFHGFDPEKSILLLKPRPNEETLRQDDILKVIEDQGDSIALILLGNSNYLTGQVFDIESITRTGHSRGCIVGFDFAHGAGNIKLDLHKWGPDFAVWCSYKYLNAGPGALSGCFVHERHSRSYDLPRFAGWWGHDKATRFQMPSEFAPIPGAEGWQLSNPPIFQLAALRASMEIFDRATMPSIREKSVKLTAFLEFLLDQLPSEFCHQITPRNPAQRGAQLSLRVRGNPKKLLEKCLNSGTIVDFREPDIIRVAPTALYNTFEDVYHFAELLGEFADGNQKH